MRQVGIAVFFIGKGHNETMGITFVQVFRTGVPAPFKIPHKREFGAQYTERPLDLFHPVIAGIVVEFEQHNMTIYIDFLTHDISLLKRVLFEDIIHSIIKRLLKKRAN